MMIQAQRVMKPKPSTCWGIMASPWKFHKENDNKEFSTRSDAWIYFKVVNKGITGMHMLLCTKDEPLWFPTEGAFLSHVHYQLHLHQRCFIFIFTKKNVLLQSNFSLQIMQHARNLRMAWWINKWIKIIISPPCKH